MAVVPAAGAAPQPLGASAAWEPTAASDSVAAAVVRRWRGRAAAAERRGDRSHVPASVSGAEAAPPPLAAGAA